MRRDPLPDHLKFGYAHAMEMGTIRQRLADDGLTGLELHFRTLREYEAHHVNDVSYRERQQHWLAQQKSFPDPCVEALKLIRDGNNDPRELARLTLEIVGVFD